MISHDIKEQTLEDIILELIECDIKAIPHKDTTFIGYLRQDKKNIFHLVNKENSFSIKCIFSQKQASTSYHMDSSEDLIISIPKLTIDYLLSTDAFGENLTISLICLLDNFNILGRELTNPFEAIPTNLNTKKKFQEIAYEYTFQVLKKMLNEVFSRNCYSEKICAKNFIQKNFPINYKNLTVFEIVKVIHKLESNINGILVKSNIPMESAQEFHTLLTEDEQETFQKLKEINWKEMLYNSATMQMKNQIHIPYEIHKDDIKDSKYKNCLMPSVSKWGYENLNATIENFLLHCVRRDTCSEEKIKNEKLPDSVANLIRKYGDVTVNIGNNTVEKYHLYKKYIKFSK